MIIYTPVPRMNEESVTTVERFPLTAEVWHRMQGVCGATNYSLALRNCEHLANYIYSGVWVSFQMTGNGVFSKMLRGLMSNYERSFINTPPKELASKFKPTGIIFTDYARLEKPYGSATCTFTKQAKVK